ncbi:HNH endonuclease signature motif containing protein [Streptomyces antibioticus]|uniref:HNH endonuclease signature motif containing protein n=1 Tax=Streptomyces antibioticus TaxID=1890 RepID=UPI0033FE1854
MAYSIGRSGPAWLRVQAQVYTEETHCWVCGTYVDQTLPGRTHPMGRTVDHIRELWQGGDPLDRTNLRLAHRRCNSAKSNRTRARPRPAYTADTTTL